MIRYFNVLSYPNSHTYYLPPLARCIYVLYVHVHISYCTVQEQHSYFHCVVFVYCTITEKLFYFSYPAQTERYMY